MTRLPFDPDKLPPRKPFASASGTHSRDQASGSSGESLQGSSHSTAGQPPLLRVSQLAERINRTLDTLPTRLRVLGEISGSRLSTHLYFALKDTNSRIAAVMFASMLRKLPFEPTDGLEVIATGRIELYKPQGKLSFIVSNLEPVGAGAHELRFRQLCEELRVLGWFDPAHKKPLPFFPRKIAVITSATGAALQDVLSTMQHRCPAVDVLVYPVRVQGEQAAGQVNAAVGAINAHAATLGIEAIIITRGGGSPEDLAAFNDKDLAHTIFNSMLPVIAAIGHETDTTIAELVADRRCATPTQAAVAITPDRDALSRQVEALTHRMTSAVRRSLREQDTRLTHAASHPVLARPDGAIIRAAEELDTLTGRLIQATRASLMHAHIRFRQLAHQLDEHRPQTTLALAQARTHSLATALGRSMTHQLHSCTQRLSSLGRELEAVGPRSVLARGFSCTLDAGGRIIRNADDLSTGHTIHTMLSRGTIISTVQATTPDTLPTSPTQPTTNRATPTPPRTQANDPPQLDLFDEDR